MNELEIIDFIQGATKVRFFRYYGSLNTLR